MQQRRTYVLEAEAEANRLEEQARGQVYGIERELTRLSPQFSQRTLDLGCGTGVLARQLVRHQLSAHVTGIDASELRIAQGRKLLVSDSERHQIHLQIGNALNLESKSHGVFDAAYARYLLEHLSTPRVALEQLHLALRPGGNLYVIELDGVFFNLYSANRELMSLLSTLRSKVDFDLYIGRKMPALLSETGFVDIRWSVEAIACQGELLLEEHHNMAMRFGAMRGFLASTLGSTSDAERLETLYLAELLEPSTTLFFNKVFCSAKKPK